jgi:hypothetical protein
MCVGRRWLRARPGRRPVPRHTGRRLTSRGHRGAGGCSTRPRPDRLARGALRATTRGRPTEGLGLRAPRPSAAPIAGGRLPSGRISPVAWEATVIIAALAATGSTGRITRWPRSGAFGAVGSLGLRPKVPLTACGKALCDRAATSVIGDGADARWGDLVTRDNGTRRGLPARNLVVSQISAVDLDDAFSVMPTPGNITGAQRMGGRHHDVCAAAPVPARLQAGAEDLESILPAGGVV